MISVKSKECLFFIQDIFPRDYYEALLANLPDPAAMRPINGTGIPSALRSSERAIARGLLAGTYNTERNSRTGAFNEDDGAIEPRNPSSICVTASVRQTPC